MLTRVSIRNFQSLRHVDLDLGTFTVIVGPSSSGKSAVIRALKALASNVRGAGVITRGQKMMTIAATTDTHTIVFERGEKVGSYRLAENGNEPQTYGKLNGGVPKQITDALRIDPVTDAGSVNFASQFDKPYLLDETGSAVARELGELTNVNRIFEAVRLANKIRNQNAATLKNRRADLDLLTSRLADYSDLPQRLALLAEAEKIDERRRELAAKIRNLQQAIAIVTRAREVLDNTIVPEVPDDTEFKALATRYLDLKAKVNSLVVKGDRLRRAEQQATDTGHELAHCEMAFKTALIQAKVCPTCGQATVDHAQSESR